MRSTTGRRRHYRRAAHGCPITTQLRAQIGRTRFTHDVTVVEPMRNPRLE